MGYKVLDLFAGAGGMSLGFSDAGFDVAAAIEIDKDAVKTHSRNFPKTSIIQEDIRHLNPSDIYSKEEFDVIIGGPPCQGFSTIGRPKIASLVKQGIWNHMKVSIPRFIDDPRNILYKKFVEFVRELKPSFFLMENVPGVLSYKNGEIAKQINTDFNKLKYKSDLKLELAAHYGVPQLRKRLFFIGNNLGFTNKFPDPKFFPKKTPMRLRDNYGLIKPKNFVTVGEAILDLPEIKNCRGAEEMEYVKDPRNDYQVKMRMNSKQAYNHVSRCTNNRDLRAFKALKQGQVYKDLPQEIKDSLPFRQDIFQDKFKRLDSQKPSWTLVAHLYKDGYMYIHPFQDRSITVREAARLQSFPDSFVFKCSRTAQFKQVGNAVPPLLAQAIADEIKKALI